MSGHLSHSRQQVKIFAQNECGASKPVVSFITPIDTGHLLDTPRHAAIFVSLLKHEDECSMFGSRVDSWTSLHAFLCRGKGVSMLLVEIKHPSWVYLSISQRASIAL